MYSLTTNKIKVSVMPYYMEGQSITSEEQFTWAYRILIENLGEKIVQLISRHWVITDANGLTKEVKGPGVVGEQPVLIPGQIYEYTSGVSLTTQSGLMAGTYQMVEIGDDGEPGGKIFNIDIPAFSLDTPEQLKKPN